MVSGTFDGVQRSTDEALEYFKFIAGEADYVKYFGKEASKPIGKALKNTVTEQATKQATKQAAKLTGKAGMRSFMKKIPVIAGIAGIGFGIQRALEGDYLGAGLEITSGLLGAISPLTGGAGTGLSYAIDGFLLGRDLGMMPMANGGLLSAATPVIAGERGREAIAPLEGSEGQIAGSVFGDATAESLVNFFAKRTNKGALPKSLLDAYPNLDPTKARDYMKLKRLMREAADLAYERTSNPNEMSNMLNNSSAQTSLGGMFVAPTIINNYSTVTAGGGGDNSEEVGNGAFPYSFTAFNADYSLMSK